MSIHDLNSIQVQLMFMDKFTTSLLCERTPVLLLAWTDLCRVSSHCAAVKPKYLSVIGGSAPMLSSFSYM